MRHSPFAVTMSLTLMSRAAAVLAIVMTAVARTKHARAINKPRLVFVVKMFGILVPVGVLFFARIGCTRRAAGALLCRSAGALTRSKMVKVPAADASLSRNRLALSLVQHVIENDPNRLAKIIRAMTAAGVVMVDGCTQAGKTC